MHSGLTTGPKQRTTPAHFSCSDPGACPMTGAHRFDVLNTMHLPA